MKLIRGIHNIKKYHYNCVLTIGNFDGVHRGHQVILQQLKQEGKRLGLPIIVMFFEPQPLEVLKIKKTPARLTCLRDKIKYLTLTKVDYLLCIKFNSYFASYTAQNFIDELLVKKLGVRLLIVGDDFHFGSKRKGNFNLLKKAGKKNNFTVINTSTLYENNQRISSTGIRNALSKDDLLLAENLLGHPYSISGRVIHGKKIGRTINFPTANLSLKHVITPIKGVYAVEVYGLTPNPIPGVANIGTCPTISGTYQKLEVYLLDIKMDFYGHYIDVVLRTKLRNEKRFSSLNILKQQINNDVIEARKFFKLKTLF